MSKKSLPWSVYLLRKLIAVVGYMEEALLSLLLAFYMIPYLLSWLPILKSIAYLQGCPKVFA